MSGRQTINCRMCTISDVISRYELEQVDLLKVDAERGELDILSGILETDWPKIRSLVVEVHNAQGRAETVTKMLLKFGFSSIMSEEDPLLHSTGLINIYARR